MLHDKYRHPVDRRADDASPPCGDLSPRAADLRTLRDGVLDVLVIGGGIVGAGVIRDAALRGFRVGLIEQRDFAFGTSSRTSRLLHGGLRYLAQGRLGLVREASIEKRTIHRIAPHLAAPLAFLFPTYRGTQWPRWQLSIGVKLYDLLCGGNNFGRSLTLNPRDAGAQLPGIEREGLTGAVQYFDAYTNDSRLVIDTIFSAVRLGAAACNYVRFEEALPIAGGWCCRLHDQLTDERFEVRTRTVVNATGPWGDRIRGSKLQLRATKGVHLIIDRERLPVPSAVVMAQDKRILFAIPWGDRAILGATDDDYQGNPEDVSASLEDIDGICAVVNRFFPDTRLNGADVRSVYAGLRPLLATKRGTPSDISRAHSIIVSAQGWLDVAGGKLTTHRMMAEQAVDRLLPWLPKRNVRCLTAVTPLLATSDTCRYSGLLPPPVSRQAVEHYCLMERAVRLDDVLVRRSRWNSYVTHPFLVADQVACWMAQILGWTDAERAKEIEYCRNEIEGGVIRALQSVT